MDSTNHTVNHPLANRIRKNKRQLQAYIKRHQLHCYRLFDWDMPEYPLCIDMYESNVHISEYKTRFTRDESSYSMWLEESLMIIRDVLQIEDHQLFFKRRERQKGETQYEKVAEQKTIYKVRENDLTFLVNLSDYVDTGLFLDHRVNREIIRASAANKNVLNLFAYTGSFSVYAAAGGAQKVTTVDLSNTYLNWAKDNFKVNNLPVHEEDFIKADVKEWIKQEPSILYDIVVLDPPTISRSKMSRSSFDVQRDHPELLFHVMRHMKPGGILYFSTNFREFEFSPKRLQVKSIEDITLDSIPEDFRNKKIHYCWRITK